MLQHLEQSDDRDVAYVSQEPRAGLLHVIAAESEDVEVGPADAQLADELASVHVARGLAAREKKPRGRQPLEYRAPTTEWRLRVTPQ